MEAQFANPASAQKRVLPARVICVMWHAPGCSVNPELAGVLQRWQGLLVTECSSAPAAIAHLMCLERSMRKAEREATVLLLIEPEKLLGVCDVLCVLDKVSPTTRSWCYESGSPEMLRAITPVDVARFTRVSLQQQQARRPESTPHIHITAAASASAERFSAQDKAADLRLAQSSYGNRATQDDAGFPRMSTSPGMRVVPQLNLHAAGDQSDQMSPRASDNRQNATQKISSGISNVLTPDEMAMLLADDPKSGHT